MAIVAGQHCPTYAERVVQVRRCAPSARPRSGVTPWAVRAATSRIRPVMEASVDDRTPVNVVVDVGGLGSCAVRRKPPVAGRPLGKPRSQ